MDELTFHFGARIHCTDDTFGALSKVAINPATLQVADLIVENGLLLKRSRVVPLTRVSTIGDDGIYLTLTCEEVAQLPEYRETKTERPLPGNGATVNLDTTYATTPVVPMVTEIVREGVSQRSRFCRQVRPYKPMKAPLARFMASTPGRPIKK